MSVTPSRWSRCICSAALPSSCGPATAAAAGAGASHTAFGLDGAVAVVALDLPFPFTFPFGLFPEPPLSLSRFLLSVLSPFLYPPALAV